MDDYQNNQNQGNGSSQGGDYQSGNYQNGTYQSGGYQGSYQGNTNQYQQPGYYGQPPLKDDSHFMTMKDWLITWLIMIIPFANIVMPFVWAFGTPSEPKFQSRKTMFQAYLVLALIAVIICIVIVAITGVSLLNYIERADSYRAANFY